MGRRSEVTRLRYFGGSTNHWNGACWPLDEIDFQERDWVPYSGWPFSKAHLNPYYERAQVICQLGPCRYDAEFWEKSYGWPVLPFNEKLVQTRIMQTKRTRFGEIYREDIAQAKNIALYLYANVVDIETTENAKTVTKVRVQSLEGKRFFISAKVFVLATGGIENARLLLLSNKVQSTGLGNQYDLVGRFFMDHPTIMVGQFLPSDPERQWLLYNPLKSYEEGKTRVVGALVLSEEVQRRERLLNYGCTLWPINAESLANNPGVKSFLKLLSRELGKDEGWKEHLGRVIADLDDVGVAIYKKVIQGRSPYDLKIEEFNIGAHTEAAPNPESRVTLSHERDRLGLNRVRLDWRVGELEKRTFLRAAEIIGQAAGLSSLGRVRLMLDSEQIDWTTPRTETTQDWPSGSYHHIGTTRMHVDPKRGVVDKNCRVHGVSNLFIAGSSVFPTSGHVNPTLTIVALSIRLADHIKSEMESGVG